MPILNEVVKCKKCNAFIGDVTGTDKKQVKAAVKGLPKECPGGCKETE